MYTIGHKGPCDITVQADMSRFIHGPHITFSKQHTSIGYIFNSIFTIY